MKFSTIRSRMLTAALVPVLLVTVGLVAVFGLARFDDVDASHDQRARLLARQIALASEYPLFSGNVSGLQSMLHGVLREPDMRSVCVFDVHGTLIGSAGHPSAFVLQPNALSMQTPLQFSKHDGVDVVREDIVATNVPVDDLYSRTQGGVRASSSPVIGSVVLEMSRTALNQKERELLFTACLVGVLGVVLGSILAIRLGRRVVEPIGRVSWRMERIGAGDFFTSERISERDPLHDLHHQLNEMACRLAWGREELEKQIEQATHELRQKKEEAETANLAKSRFLATASHDLRQPTHALGMFVARLGQLPLSTDASELVASLEASVQAMQDLLDGLLDLSRLDAGAVQVHRRPCNLDEILDTMRTAIEPSARSKGLRLRVRPCRMWAMTDPILLQRILLNLLQNAVRYTDRGTVMLACRPVCNGEGIRIDVLDSGIGIAPQDQEQVFKEFFQVGNASRSRSQGMGLGLNIVERTARLMDHPVGLRSTLGGGTRFSITVPRVGPLTPALPPASEEIYHRFGFDGLRVLLVEDDGFALEAVGVLLQSWKCDVRCAESLAAALQHLEGGWRPEVLLSDYRLGHGSNGLDAVRELRRVLQLETPACLMSGDTDAELMQAAKDAGLPMLHKPVRPAKLKNLLRRLSMAALGQGEAP